MVKIPRTREELAARIDHTILKPDATKDDIVRVVNEAKKYKFRSVCVPQYWVPLAKELLRGTNIMVITVVGFPFGYDSTPSKVSQAETAKKLGADEIDMVMNISAFKSGTYEDVSNDIKSVVAAAKPLPVKVIIETSYLTREEIEKAAKIAVESGAAFVKTNTGFGKRGAEIEDVKIIRRAIGDKAKVKASGGIRDAKKALEFIIAGADVIGASAGVNIVETFDEKILKELGVL